MNTSSSVETRIARLAHQFRDFATVRCVGQSPLYEHLSLAVADQEDILAIAAETTPGQPIPNMLFAAVQFLVLKEPDHPLAGFYRSCTRNPLDPASAFPHFAAFVRANEATIRAILRRRRVQTNEVGRCSYLMPAFTLIHRRAGDQPLALVEVGASAGLILAWDRYAYLFGPESLTAGHAASTVRIESEFRGSQRPPISARLPQVVSRVGIDLNVIDLRNEDDALWLRALVWPDQIQRAELLSRAIEEFLSNPVRLVQGNGIGLLPDLVAQVPADASLCVFHTYTLNQFSVEDRERFKAVLCESSRARPLYQLSAEWFGDVPKLELTVWDNSSSRAELLAYCDHHGRWMEWLVET